MFRNHRILTLNGFWRFAAGMGYQLSRYILVAVFSFPVALVYILSALLLDPSVPASQKHRLSELIIDRFDQIFQYSVTLALLLSVGVSLVMWFRSAKERLSKTDMGKDSQFQIESTE
ncbi:MAG: hypothetical protein AB2761_20625 [Candidatus Thiodiazotropha endolucinida]